MWNSKILFGKDSDKHPILSVLGKRTYSFENGKKAVVDLKESIPFFESDVYLSEENPQNSPILIESDLVPYKPYVDVIFIGKALAPDGRRARFFDLIVAVNQSRKVIRIIGNRSIIAKPGGFDFTEPELFSEMPLHYGLAYGGMDTLSSSTQPFVYPKNPIGKGFFVSPKAIDLHDQALPNIECPENMLHPSNLLLGKFENWPSAPDPEGVGYYPKSAWPRFNGFADTLENQLHTINNCASPGLQFPNLAGNEQISMMYMDKDQPKFFFHLPDDIPKAILNFGQGDFCLPTTLQTVVVHKLSNQVTLLWRAEHQIESFDQIKNFENLDHKFVSDL